MQVGTISYTGHSQIVITLLYMIIDTCTQKRCTSDALHCCSFAAPVIRINLLSVCSSCSTYLRAVLSLCLPSISFKCDVSLLLLLQPAILQSIKQSRSSDWMQRRYFRGVDMFRSWRQETALQQTVIMATVLHTLLMYKSLYRLFIPIEKDQ